MADTRVIHNFYSIDPKQGFYGGGGIDDRAIDRGLPMTFALNNRAFSDNSWGSDFKRRLERNFTHTCSFNGHTTSLPLSSNSVTLDPEVRDKFGRPALRNTYMDHPDDLQTMKFFAQRSMELMDAASALEVVPIYPQNGQDNGTHLLGTCRMGDDPSTSVVDKYHRSHDVPNLYMVDGGSMLTSGRVQPTMTIMALAFRAADHIIRKR